MGKSAKIFARKKNKNITKKHSVIVFLYIFAPNIVLILKTTTMKNWITNGLKSEERTIIRDLLSVAIADNEIKEDEKKALLDICQAEGISLSELMDSIRNKKVGTATALLSMEDKKAYLLQMIRMMSADGVFSPLELHVIEIIAKKICVTPNHILLFVLDEIKANNISKEEGIEILDHFVKHLIVAQS